MKKLFEVRFKLNESRIENIEAETKHDAIESAYTRLRYMPIKTLVAVQSVFVESEPEAN